MILAAIFMLLGLACAVVAGAVLASYNGLSLLAILLASAAVAQYIRITRAAYVQKQIDRGHGRRRA